MNYYNENDPKAAAWLRELIKAGQIPPGHIDQRDIRQVQPGDLTNYVQCHFFAGIGGWSYALALAQWPQDQPVWTGSCPCQPFSGAGKAEGLLDQRHLWPAFRRLIAQCHPPVILGEQVASKDGRHWLAGVRADLERMDYAVGAADLCAAGSGAPHIRQRLFWVGQSHRQQDHAPKPGQCLPRSGCDPLLRDGSAIQRTEEVRPGGLDNTKSDGCEMRPHVHARMRRKGSGERCNDGNGGLVDSERSERRPPTEGRVNDHDRANAKRFETPSRLGIHGPWDNYQLIPCRDGKARRIESGTFPLVDGLPGRVGLLRGYGNAIVPQVAAEFIQAYREAIANLQPAT